MDGRLLSGTSMDRRRYKGGVVATVRGGIDWQAPYICAGFITPFICSSLLESARSKPRNSEAVPQFKTPSKKKPK